MAYAIALSLDGDKTVVRKLGKLAAAVKDWSVPFGQLSDDLVKYAGGQVFEQQGQAERPWQPLSEATIKARSRRWGYYKNPPAAGSSGDSPILVWTGRMRGGFKREVTPMSFRIYNPVPYFGYHQRGGRNLPQRKMLELTQDRVYTIMRFMQQYVEKEFENG